MTPGNDDYTPNEGEGFLLAPGVGKARSKKAKKVKKPAPKKKTVKKKAAKKKPAKKKKK